MAAYIGVEWTRMVELGESKLGGRSKRFMNWTAGTSAARHERG